LLITTGLATVVIAVVAVLLPSGRRAIAAAHASTGPTGS
jgi:DHA3 family macrolide efflux protein-like MFS transporter